MWKISVLTIIAFSLLLGGCNWNNNDDLNKETPMQDVNNRDDNENGVINGDQNIVPDGQDDNNGILDRDNNDNNNGIIDNNDNDDDLIDNPNGVDENDIPQVNDKDMDSNVDTNGPNRNNGRINNNK